MKRAKYLKLLTSSDVFDAAETMACDFFGVSGTVAADVVLPDVNSELVRLVFSSFWEVDVLWALLTRWITSSTLHSLSSIKPCIISTACLEKGTNLH